jgi:hypothetical protein
MAHLQSYVKMSDRRVDGVANCAAINHAVTELYICKYYNASVECSLPILRSFTTGMIKAEIIKARIIKGGRAKMLRMRIHN